ncbi:MAG: SDR family oxidoreductase [Methylocystaceae bacterium]|nr:SDR family oxidoreductase [Methylocystaceae bacterium]
MEGPLRLDGKVTIVTGAASGIGLATAELFLSEGSHVVIADNNKAAAEKAAAALKGKGKGQCLPVSCNVANAADVENLFSVVMKQFGRIDVLVNNAGYGIAGTVSQTSDQDWDDLMAVNVRGVFLCCKHGIMAMKKTGGGVIVNVASVVAAVGIRNRAAYVASKGAVAALTRSIALDYVNDHIRCNAIAPGTIETPYYTEILAKAEDPVAIKKGLEARQPMGRLGTPDEIANGILFLACDESRFATGTILTIDGGMTAQ